MSLLSAAVVVTIPRETIAFNQRAERLPESIRLCLRLDHTSAVADFLCFLDCSSQAENFPYIPWKGLAVIVLMEYLPVAR